MKVEVWMNEETDLQMGGKRAVMICRWLRGKEEQIDYVARVRHRRTARETG
jgi:hypothetical protein